MILWAVGGMGGSLWRCLKTTKKTPVGDIYSRQSGYQDMFYHFTEHFIDSYTPQRGSAPCWKACDLHENMNCYLTRKLRATGEDFFEKSWSRTLRSICNHLRWPLQKQKGRSIRKLYFAHMHTCCMCGHKLDILHTCHQKRRVQKIPSLWGWSGRKPSRGVRTTAA